MHVGKPAWTSAAGIVARSAAGRVVVSTSCTESSESVSNSVGEWSGSVGVSESDRGERLRLRRTIAVKHKQMALQGVLKNLRMHSKNL